VNGYSKEGHKVVIAVAEDLSPLHAAMQTFRFRFTIIFLVGIVLLIGLQTWLVRAGIRTLTQTRNDIARLEQGEIEHINEDVPVEIAPLVKEVNRLLSILRQRLKRSRNALGNLAHALKTPLTLLTQLTDDPLLATYPVLQERFQSHIRTLGFLIERELKRARLAGGGLILQPIDVTAASRDLIPVFRALYHHKRLVIDTQLPPPISFKGDREDLLELLGNLLDNACKWAQRRIRLSVLITSPLTLIIEDDGPGCTPETLEHLTQRGLRLDEAAPGHGLGLSIVKDIVNSYGGAIDFALSPELGGLRVTVQLPDDLKSIA
jgi:signal transduction histidine kinase